MIDAFCLSYKTKQGIYIYYHINHFSMYLVFMFKDICGLCGVFYYGSLSYINTRTLIQL